MRTCSRPQGAFRLEGWPVKGVQTIKRFPSADGTLAAAASQSAVQSLPYRAGSGIDAGNWWGETTGDMRPADAAALVYDSEALAEPVRLLGSAQVVLRVKADAAQANWIARIEDVFPDGRVSLVTGGLINGNQRMSRSEPAPIIPGEWFTLRFPLRFTTYTFEPQHRMRLVVANAQFPMIWPSPQSMVTALNVGGDSFVELPLVQGGTEAAMPQPIEPAPEPPGVEYIYSEPLTHFKTIRDDPDGITEVQAEESSKMRIDQRIFTYKNVVSYSVDNRAPAHAEFKGAGREDIEFGGRTLTMLADVSVVSSETVFKVLVTRQIQENGRTVRSRTWNEEIPRDFQ